MKPKVRRKDVADRVVYTVEYAGKLVFFPDWESAMHWANQLAWITAGKR